MFYRSGRWWTKAVPTYLCGGFTIWPCHSKKHPLLSFEDRLQPMFEMRSKHLPPKYKGGLQSLSLKKVATAPFSKAVSMKSWPSRAPFNGTKGLPAQSNGCQIQVWQGPHLQIGWYHFLHVLDEQLHVMWDSYPTPQFSVTSSKIWTLLSNSSHYTIF